MDTDTLQSAEPRQPSKKQYWYVIAALLVAGFLLALRFSVDSTAPRREELPALPGGVVYQEGSSTVPGLFQEAKTLLANRDLVQAEKVYRKIVAVEPNNALGYIGVAACRYWQDDFEGAAAQYQKALAMEPKSIQALVGLGSATARRGQYETSVDFYERALAIDENLADAHLGLAITQDDRKKNEQALRHYERFLELAPTSGFADKVRNRIAELRKQVGRKP